jgi:threonylcarbamoyladenosine tRNA methylthiotransferase MtaB
MSAGTFRIITLGCKVNQYESDGLVQALTTAGWEPAAADGPADLCVINTCAVTGSAAMQGRGAVRRAIRENPAARIAVTGCYAQVAAEEIEAIPGVDLIVGHGDKHRLPEIVSRWVDPAPKTIRRSLGPSEPFAPFPPAPPASRTRPNLKIQDGCSAFCTYCIVPYARGPSRSMDQEEVLDHLLALGASGYREVVLSGIHLGCYGLDQSPPVSLAGLMDRIAAERPVERIRLSSIEPPELTDGIIRRVAASHGFCRHFHLPLQSGDNDILQRMGRPYDAALFRDRVECILERVPEAAIGVDVLVGFPGETDAAFDRTFRLIRDLPAAYLHVFPFSPRPGTPAATFPDPVSPAVIKARCAALREEGNRKKAAFFRRQKGRIRRVLVEERRDAATGLLRGMTDTYVPILLAGSDDLKKKLVDVKIIEIIEAYSVHGVIDHQGATEPSVSAKNT